ncbi:MAG: flagellar M-ring protein FliF [SAR324 cluster bacterium]|nr:flagellar M-ring protein FliF [SAR324 cluster bacterium]
MAEQANPLKDISFQFQNFFGSLTLAKRITILVSLGIILAGMITIVIVSNRDTWAPLYSNMDPGDASKIVEKLQENQIPFMLAPGGRTVMVPPHMVDQARLTMASEKVLPGSGVGFMDMFGTPSLGETEFQQQVKYRIAQEGELARLIGRITNIKSAKVSLALPQKTLFSDSQEQPTAAVSLDVAGSLSRQQVETVSHLVAASVEGMEPKFVRITDQSGNLLSRGLEDESLGGKLSEHYTYKRRLEANLEKEILDQLEPIVGVDRVKVKVAAKLKFDRETVKEQRIDPEQTAIISEQVSNENSTGSRSIPVGPAGVSTNLPEATGREAATVTDFGKQNSTRNFDISRQEVFRESATGKIMGLSIAVLLDHKHPAVMDGDGKIVGRENIPWTVAEKEEISNLVKAAIGFTNNDERKDNVFVANMSFGKPVEEDQQAQVEETRRQRIFILDIVRYSALGVAILALIMLVIRPMVQRLSAKPADLDLLMGLPATIGELEGEELEIPTEREAGIPPRDKIIDIARQDPLKTASLIRAWLRDKK